MKVFVPKMPATEILRSEVGSTLHGTGMDGAEDRDEMGVAVEDPECVTGLRLFEQAVHRTQPEGVRSGPGDLDLTVYGLRKWMRLAVQGNPTVLLLLFAPDDKLVVRTDLGEELRSLAPAIVSRRAIPRFRGYLRSQALRLLGLAGQRHGAAARRPELVERFGHDTKFAMHMVRLGLQGVELATTGRLTLPMPEAEREVCRSVRYGRTSADEALRLALDLDAKLESLLTTSPLPDDADLPRINVWMHDAYLRTWGTDGA